MTQSYQFLQAFKSFPKKPENRAGGEETGGDCSPQLIHLSNDSAEILSCPVYDLAFIYSFLQQTAQQNLTLLGISRSREQQIQNISLKQGYN